MSINNAGTGAYRSLDQINIEDFQKYLIPM